MVNDNQIKTFRLNFDAICSLIIAYQFGGIPINGHHGGQKEYFWIKNIATMSKYSQLGPLDNT